MSTVEELYSAAEKLSAAPKDEIMKLQSSYEVILSGVKGDSSCKRLASQFISRFFARFPNSASRGLDAVLDLCEDDDVNIRKQAIKDLPTLCRELKSYLPKICDVLTQLLSTDGCRNVCHSDVANVAFQKGCQRNTCWPIFADKEWK